MSFIVIPHLVFGRWGLLVGFIATLSMNCLVFFYGDLRLTRLFEATQLEGQDPWGVLTQVEKLCHKLNLKVPRVLLMNLSTPTAFSIGLFESHNTVLLSESLLEEFSPREVEAVLAFELVRLKRHDSFVITVVASLASVIFFIGHIIDDALFFQVVKRRRACQLGPGTWALAPLMLPLIRIGVGRKNFYKADQEAAELLGDRVLFAETLLKLSSYNAARPLPVALFDSPLFIVNPLTSCSWCRYFQMQPNVERRIRYLVGHFPI